MAIKTTQKDERNTVLDRVSNSLKESFAKISWRNMEDNAEESRRLEKIMRREKETKQIRMKQHANEMTAIMYRRMA